MSKQNGTIRACSSEELESKQSIVVSGPDVPIIIFYNQGDPRAVDNRCPHMGFPFSKGTDDVDSYRVTVENNEVFVHTAGPGRDPIEHGKRRLKEGMEQNLRLVQGKAIVKMLCAGGDPDEITQQAALYGVRHRGSGWGDPG